MIHHPRNLPLILSLFSMSFFIHRASNLTKPWSFLKTFLASSIIKPLESQGESEIKCCKGSYSLPKTSSTMRSIFRFPRSAQKIPCKYCCALSCSVFCPVRKNEWSVPTNNCFETTTKRTCQLLISSLLVWAQECFWPFTVLLLKLFILYSL